MTMHRHGTAAALVAVLALPSCVTNYGGKYTQLTVTDVPTGAKVYAIPDIDWVTHGGEAILAELKDVAAFPSSDGPNATFRLRRHQHTIAMSKDGKWSWKSVTLRNAAEVTGAPGGPASEK